MCTSSSSAAVAGWRFGCMCVGWLCCDDVVLTHVCRLMHLVSRPSLVAFPRCSPCVLRMTSLSKSQTFATSCRLPGARMPSVRACTCSLAPFLCNVALHSHSLMSFIASLLVHSREDQEVQGHRQVQDPLQPRMCHPPRPECASCFDVPAILTPHTCRFVCCLQYLYTLTVKDADKAEKLTQSLPPGTLSSAATSTCCC